MGRWARGVGDVGEAEGAMIGIGALVLAKKQIVATEKARVRRVLVTDRDGKVVRETIVGEILHGLSTLEAVSEVEPADDRCAVCNALVTDARALARARSYGRSPYCERHKGHHPQRTQRVPCFICGRASTENSSALSRSRGTNAYCSRHTKPSSQLVAAFDWCVRCGRSVYGRRLASRKYAGLEPKCERCANSRLTTPKCCECGGKLSPTVAVAWRRDGQPKRCLACRKNVVLLPCAICGEPSSRASTIRVRCGGARNALCPKHAGRKIVVLPRSDRKMTYDDAQWAKAAHFFGFSYKWIGAEMGLKACTVGKYVRS